MSNQQAPPNLNLIRSTFEQCSTTIKKSAICSMAGVEPQHLKDWLRNKGTLQAVEADSITRQLVQLKNAIARAVVTYDAKLIMQLISDRRLRHYIITSDKARAVEHYRNGRAKTDFPQELWENIKENYKLLLPKILN